MLTQLVGWNLEYNVMHPIRNQYQEMNNSRVMENNDKIQKKIIHKNIYFFSFSRCFKLVSAVGSFS